MDSPRRKNLKPQHPLRFYYPKVIGVFVLLGLLLLSFSLIYDYGKQKLPGFNEVHWVINGQLPQLSLNIIKKRIAPLLDTNYADIDTHKIKCMISENAWVDEVLITRPFWSKLEVIISVKKIALRFNYDDYIDKKGDVFNPRYHLRSTSTVALAIGHWSDSRAIYQAYQTYQSILGADFVIQVIKQLSTTDLIINNNTTLKLGYDKQQQRLRRFYGLYPKLKEKYGTIDHFVIDLRYKQGFSITQPD